jgi:hypothetical protein
VPLATTAATTRLGDLARCRCATLLVLAERPRGDIDQAVATFTSLQFAPLDQPIDFGAVDPERARNLGHAQEALAHGHQPMFSEVREIRQELLDNDACRSLEAPRDLWSMPQHLHRCIEGKEDPRRLVAREDDLVGKALTVWHTNEW